jgi:hypothetical protein
MRHAVWPVRTQSLVSTGTLHISKQTLTQFPCLSSPPHPPPPPHTHPTHTTTSNDMLLHRWSYVGKASELGARFCCSFQPRRQLQLRDLGPTLLRAEFDFTGVLVWAGPVMPDGEEGGCKGLANGCAPLLAAGLLHTPGTAEIHP